MMAGNPSWWSLSDKAQQTSAFLPPCPSLFPQFAPGSSSLPLNSCADQDFPQSWSQLLMGGLASEEEADNKFGGGSHFQHKRLENWEDQQNQQILINPSLLRVPIFDIKQEDAHSSQVYGTHRNVANEFQTSSRPNSWSPVVMGVSSPRSSVTTTNSTSSNMLDFSGNKGDGRIQYPDHSSECNSTAAGGVSKKAKVQSTPTLPPLKVRKEKLGDRITALHQLVSPFGKTDTASVLLEAIGYIGFLQSQIEALSSPYLSNSSANMRHQQTVEGDRNCTFQEDYAQGDEPKDLRSRGLCLVPLSCTQHVGSENGADYWAPPLGGGF